MNEWQQRAFTGIIILIFALWWLFFMPPLGFVLLLSALGIVATHELLSMLRMPQAHTLLLLSLPAWLGLCMGLPLSGGLALIAISWSLLTLMNIKKADELAAAFTRLAWAQWMMLWLMLFAWSLLALRQQEQGLWWLAGACAGVWMADTAAYICGKRWGKHKLCPAISPGKTIEGIIGGLVMGCALATTIWSTQLAISVWLALPLAIILVLCAVLGDLNESALKRVVGVKDSGNILPGHGGLLDRIDALLPAIPFITASASWLM